MKYLFEHLGVTVSAVSGVLAAGGKRIDLFGVIVLAVVTALGGGTLRDMALRKGEVFWIQDSNYVLTAVGTAVMMFFIARRWRMPPKSLAIADAFALGFFTILGAAKALVCDAGPFNAVVLGVMTGVAGGILRDVLVGEIPLVFRPATYLYATAAFAGATVFVCAERWMAGNPANRWLGAGTILALRLTSIQWRWSLPVFESKG